MIIGDSSVLMKLDGETGWNKRKLLLLSGGHWYERRGRVFYPYTEDIPTEDPCRLIVKGRDGRVLLIFDFDNEEQKEYAAGQIARFL